MKLFSLSSVGQVSTTNLPKKLCNAGVLLKGESIGIQPPIL